MKKYKIFKKLSRKCFKLTQLAQVRLHAAKTVGQMERGAERGESGRGRGGGTAVHDKLPTSQALFLNHYFCPKAPINGQKDLSTRRGGSPVVPQKNKTQPDSSFPRPPRSLKKLCSDIRRLKPANLTFAVLKPSKDRSETSKPTFTGIRSFAVTYTSCFFHDFGQKF